MASKRKKTRMLVTVLGVLGLLVVGLFLLDGWVRQQVAGVVRQKVSAVLKLDSQQPVTVSIAGVSVLAQLATGKLDEVDVAVDKVAFGELTGAVTFTARGMPIDGTKPVDHLQVDLRVSENGVKKLFSSLSPSTVDSLTLSNNQIEVGGTVAVFGVPISVRVGIEPTARDGELGFTPTSVEVNGATTSAAELTARYGPLASALVGTRSFCVASLLPKALHLDAVAVRGNELVVTIAAKTLVLSDASLSALGSCPKG
ncbi:MAG: LmeA family phospholipid-binding protein [Lacisediminihabitans sp.]